MSQFELNTMDEYERQFYFIQALQKLEFNTSKNFKKFDDEENKMNIQNAEVENETNETSADELSRENSTTFGQPASLRTLDIINKKISNLDSIFSNKFDKIKATGRRSSYEIEPDLKKKEEISIRKKKEEKQINLFSGIYSFKSVIYDLKTEIPPPIAGKKEENSENTPKIPKLVELYQFGGFDSSLVTPLPHEILLEDVQEKVIESILILNRQPHYKNFLLKFYFSKPCQILITDAFWWCFLERYQKISTVQQEIFLRLSESYVELIFTDMDMRYRETFFKNLSDLVAMTVYTVFCTAFPESYMTQFNDEFREFICQACHIWISGKRPTPRSYSKWNFKVIDPASAVFAKEVLNKNQNSLDSVLNTESNNSYQESPLKSSRISDNSKTNINKKSNSASLNHKRTQGLASDTTMTTTNKSEKTNQSFRLFKKKKESHPIGKSHEFEETLFNINGNSPLVDYYLYNHNARKINTTETLIQHPQVTSLPPLNSITYKNVIQDSLKSIKVIEKDLKNIFARQKSGIARLETERAHFMKEYHKKRELLLSKPKEVNIMGDLLTMNMKKDPNTTSFGLDAALSKAFKNSAIRSRVSFE